MECRRSHGLTGGDGDWPRVALLLVQLEGQLTDGDSYVYQAAVNAYVAAANVASARVLDTLARHLGDAAARADAEMCAHARARERAREGADVGGGVAIEHEQAEPGIGPALAQALKLTQAICQVVQRVGAAMGSHARVVTPVLLRCCDARAPRLLNAGALVALADTCVAAGAGFHPWAPALVEVCAAALAADADDADVRRAAAQALNLVMAALGAQLIDMAGAPAVKQAYRALTLVRERASDELLVRHAACALGELERACLRLLFPSAR